MQRSVLVGLLRKDVNKSYKNSGTRIQLIIEMNPHSAKCKKSGPKRDEVDPGSVK
ncbi:hypothetical protein TMU01_09730 [Tenuibacillus multivorans]|nr:hypothetical protein TMU01_09730 [Tenuibacillus multivorans]